MSKRFDVAIIGAGFAGTILARILAKQGRSVALIDPTSHPRFAIGESSTPIADSLLRRLGQRFQCEDLVNLSTHGSWQDHHPHLSCGRKRGFSYYRHDCGVEFHDNDDHGQSLLVAASASDLSADTHWYRAEVDQYFFDQAIAAGAEDLTGYSVDPSSRDEDRLILVSDLSKPLLIESEWVIDASGRAGVLAQLAGVRDRVGQLKTSTHSTFAHFSGVHRWTQTLQSLGIEHQNDPFDTDDAAQHHLLEQRWLWVLRFDNGITSVGMTSPSSSPKLDWSGYPSLTNMFRDAALVTPAGVPVSSGRIQRLFDPVVDHRRLMLPTAAVTIDPLHSTGIAHALAGVDRLATIILCRDETTRRKHIAEYRQSLLTEAQLLDRLVATAYQTMNDFPRFVAACMLYFAGAIDCEERYGRGEVPSRLWCADDDRFVAMVHTACDLLTSDASTRQVISSVRKTLAPWNSVGLMDPSIKNRYAYTATKQ